MAPSWRCHWDCGIPFFAFGAPLCKTFYTTNAIKSLHSGARKSIRNKGHFPSDEVATKLMWLALRNLTAKWKNPLIAWAASRELFSIQFAGRFRLDGYLTKMA